MRFQLQERRFCFCGVSFFFLRCRFWFLAREPFTIPANDPNFRGWLCAGLFPLITSSVEEQQESDREEEAGHLGFGRMNDVCMVRRQVCPGLLPARTAAWGMTLVGLIAPSIITRGEIEVLGLCVPRFDIREYLRRVHYCCLSWRTHKHTGDGALLFLQEAC